MASNSVAPVIPVAFHGLTFQVVGVLNNLLFYTLVLKTFQFFPKPVTRRDILRKIRFAPMRQLMLWAHHRLSWFIFPVIALAVMFTQYMMVVFIVVLLVLLMYLYLSLSKSKSDRNKVLWLFWGIDIYFACLILNILFSSLNNEDIGFVSTATSIISVMALLVALTMSFFFFDTFDTGVIVKRTIINSFMLVCIIFVYNVTEHYVLHWVSHRLHLSDALLSSLLSGILVMSFSPLHHRLMHFFEKKFKDRKD
jgi:hypothetical protein